MKDSSFNYANMFFISRKCIAWAKHTGHANDPLSIALRQFFGVGKRKVLFSLGGQHHAHKRLTVVIHDPDSPLLMHSLELTESSHRCMWGWINKEETLPFNCRVVFTAEQVDAIFEVQRRAGLKHLGIDKLTPIPKPK